MERLAHYASLSKKLGRLADEELAALVARAAPLHAGVGGRSVLLTIDSTPIFVKRIALTDQWKENLRAFLKTSQPSVPPAVAAAIRRQGPLALAFLKFSRQLREKDKQTPYPAEL